MATYYVGAGGNNSNDGLSWAQRKLTLNGAEDIPVQAGDTVYVGAGTYREKLTCDVSGSSGSPISYIGDYDGSHTDGTGGVVRVTASDDDKSSTRNMCFDISGRSYRTFDHFLIDYPGSIYAAFWCNGSADHITIRNCYIDTCGCPAVKVYSTNKLTDLLMENCTVVGQVYYDSQVQDDCGNVFQNIIAYASTAAFIETRSGGTVIKNCMFVGGANKVLYVPSLNAGQTVTITNCIMFGIGNYELSAGAVGYIIEDYNLCHSRSNVTAGAHSVGYYPLLENRWFFEMISGRKLVTPFDLASYSQLINVAGTSPTTTDMRGTAKIGDQREWGALEYDSSLDIEAGSGGGLLTNPGMTGGMRG